MTVRVPSTTKSNREQIGRYAFEALGALKDGLHSSQLDREHESIFTADKVWSLFGEDVYRLRALCNHPQERLIVAEMIGIVSRRIMGSYVMAQDHSGYDAAIRWMVNVAAAEIDVTLYYDHLFQEFLLSHALRNRDRLQEWITAQGPDFKDAHNTIGCAKALWLETWQAEIEDVVFLAFEAAILTLLSEEHYGEVYAWESQQRSKRLWEAA